MMKKCLRQCVTTIKRNHLHPITIDLACKRVKKGIRSGIYFVCIGWPFQDAQPFSPNPCKQPDLQVHRSCGSGFQKR